MKLLLKSVLVLLLASCTDRGKELSRTPISKKYSPPSVVMIPIFNGKTTTYVPQNRSERYSIQYRIKWEKSEDTVEWKTVSKQKYYKTNI